MIPNIFETFLLHYTLNKFVIFFIRLFPQTFWTLSLFNFSEEHMVHNKSKQIVSVIATNRHKQELLNIVF